jgi:hypothetical protein
MPAEADTEEAFWCALAMCRSLLVAAGLLERGVSGLQSTLRFGGRNRPMVAVPGDICGAQGFRAIAKPDTEPRETEHLQSGRTACRTVWRVYKSPHRAQRHASARGPSRRSACLACRKARICHSLSTGARCRHKEAPAHATLQRAQRTGHVHSSRGSRLPGHAGTR